MVLWCRNNFVLLTSVGVLIVDVEFSIGSHKITALSSSKRTWTYNHISSRMCEKLIQLPTSSEYRIHNKLHKSVFMYLHKTPNTPDSQ